jgi:hypothetical protein
MRVVRLIARTVDDSERGESQSSSLLRSLAAEQMNHNRSDHDKIARRRKCHANGHESVHSTDPSLGLCDATSATTALNRAIL